MVYFRSEAYIGGFISALVSGYEKSVITRTFIHPYINRWTMQYK